MPVALIYLTIIFCQMVFSATPLFSKIALEEIDPMAVAFLRFVIASVIMNLVVLIKGHKIIPDRRFWFKLLLLGLFIAPINQGFFFYGLNHTSPGHSALMFSLTPLFVYIFAMPVLKEKFYPKKLAGILTAFAGVVIILLDKNIKLEPQFVKGDLLILVAVLAWSLFFVYIKSIMSKLGSLRAYAHSITFGTLLFIPVGISSTVTFDFAPVSQLAWWSLIFISVLTVSVAFPLWYWILKYVEASRLAVYMYMQTILAAVWSYLFLSEELTHNFIIGGIVILAGVYITEKAQPLKSTINHSPSSSTE